MSALRGSGLASPLALCVAFLTKEYIYRQGSNEGKHSLKDIFLPGSKCTATVLFLCFSFRYTYCLKMVSRCLYPSHHREGSHVCSAGCLLTELWVFLLFSISVAMHCITPAVALILLLQMKSTLTNKQRN